MISSEVQRTLVKSPPELWAELSDPVALARHLGDLGEIRITRIEPERKVEWEAEHTSGTVVIKPSGWGTKVILTVAARRAEVGQTPGSPTLEAQRNPAADATASPPLPADAAEPEPEPQPALELEVEPEQDRELQPEPDSELAPTRDWDRKPEPELEERRGFFARLLRRRREQPALQPATTASSAGRSRVEWRARVTAMGQRAQPAQDLNEPEPSHEPPEPEPLHETVEPTQPTLARARAIDAPAEARAQDPRQGPEPDPERHVQPHLESGPEPNPWRGPERDPSRGPEPHSAQGPVPSPDQVPVQHPVDISAEIRAAEEVAAEHVTAVLSSVLDRLGAAHHRPFSRA